MPLGPSKFPYRKPLWPFQLNRDCAAADGLIAWWPYGVVGGTTLYDHTGYSNHVTVNGTTMAAAAAAWGTGNDGGPAIKTDGSSTYGAATVAAISGLASASIGCWLYRSASGTKQAFGFGSSSTSARFNMLWFTHNFIYISGPGSGSSFSNTTVAFTQTGWHRLDINFNGTSAMEFYFDGLKRALAGNTPTSSTMTGAGITTCWFGREISNGFCTGIYDCPTIHDTARNAQQMWSMYDPATRWQLRWKPSGRTVSAPATTTTSGLLLRRRRMMAAA